MTAKRNVAILGAGPAGLSAALWLQNLGFAPHVFDLADRAGGLQNLNFLTNDWLLGQPGHTGPALVQRFIDHARAAGVHIMTGVPPRALTGSAGNFVLQLSNDTSLGCASVVIATGTRYRAEEVLSDVQGLENIPHGCIKYGPYAFADLESCVDQRILVIGGGDNAFENVRLLASRTRSLYLAVRAQARAQQELTSAVADLEAAGRCHTLRPATVAAISHDDHTLTVTLGDGQTLQVDRIHVLAGYEPNTAFLHEMLPAESLAAMRFDRQGYLRVDAGGRCGVAGLYAAGDVCNPLYPSVVSALAQGAVAAKTIEIDLREY